MAKRKQRAARTSLEAILGVRGFSDRVTSHPEAEKLEETLIGTVKGFKQEAERLKAEIHPDKLKDRLQQRAAEILAELEQGPAGVVRLFGNRWATSAKSLERASGLSPSTDAAALSRENWLLDRLSAMDRSEQLRVLERAVETGDIATMRAALHAPPALRVFSDDRMVDDAREAWFRQHCPQQIAEHEQLSQVHEISRANYASTCDAIRQIAGFEVDGMRSRLEAAQAEQ